ncbi:MAG: hypothetical protein A2W93_09060 [Bacteroidetes bacterium GWF2_43_63]|nr:MAG: hypothetical protein A2W94_05440 [Bacteroidetes bacterium GWE2_42_42]OFY54446.1 MAG: hypothetical protein A2W93_09060 [Bacteroidetes bacterium GWF2_43_63]HBG70394.1 hypothetical protein [Bacteroidales bacterium]HCB63489.1 hypothetical protein [Bacteroidales bacterium]
MIFEKTFRIFEKKAKVTTADLKLKIFRQLDSLQKNRLDEVYGMLMNYFRGQKDIDDWDNLSEEQKQGIIDAAEQMEQGKNISHQKVMANARIQYR